MNQTFKKDKEIFLWDLNNKFLYTESYFQYFTKTLYLEVDQTLFIFTFSMTMEILLYGRR